MFGGLQAEMEIDAASADVEDDTLTNIDADTLTHIDNGRTPQHGDEQSMSSAATDKQPLPAATVSSNKRKHTPVDPTATKSKVARSVLMVSVMAAVVTIVLADVPCVALLTAVLSQDKA